MYNFNVNGTLLD